VVFVFLERPIVYARFPLFELLDFLVQCVYNTISLGVLDFSRIVIHVSSSFVSVKSIYLNNLLLFFLIFVRYSKTSASVV
jgi:hypothetical protein